MGRTPAPSEKACRADVRFPSQYDYYPTFWGTYHTSCVFRLPLEAIFLRSGIRRRIIHCGLMLHHSMFHGFPDGVLHEVPHTLGIDSCFSEVPPLGCPRR